MQRPPRSQDWPPRPPKLRTRRPECRTACRRAMRSGSFVGRKLCGRRGASTWARQEERVALLLSAGLFGSLSENHAIGPSSHFFKRGACAEAASACRASIVVGQAKIRRGTCGLVDLKKQTKASIFESCCKSASPCPLLISPARCTARRLAARASDNPWSQNWAQRKMQRPPRSGRTTQLYSSQCH